MLTNARKDHSIPLLIYVEEFGKGSAAFRSPGGVFFDRGHPCFGNFNSAIPVDIVRVKSYLNCLFDPACLPVWIMINKLYLIPKRVVSGVVGVLWNGGGLDTGESDVPVVFFDPVLHSQGILPVSAAKFTSARLEDLCKTGSKNGQYLGDKSDKRGAKWDGFRSSFSLKFTEMKLRPSS
ncbi:hypothetical protein ACROYT_G025933 [Oculina patagonica]